MLPAYFRRSTVLVTINKDNVDEFLANELSLGKLEKLLEHLWFAGSKRLPIPLHENILIGREMVITERMDLHLLWTSDRRLLIKPLPCFLLDLSFWAVFSCCQSSCDCSSLRSAENMGSSNTALFRECSRRALRRCAMGFLYSYVSLISHESDYSIALESHLLPSELSVTSWQDWKKFTREVIAFCNDETVHPRFLRAELRLSRLNNLCRFTQAPLFEPYLRQYWDYSSLLQENITLLATTIIFIVLILTAMQVGLATEQLNNNKRFMAASYGFTAFAILFPFCALGLVAIRAVWQIVKDLPILLNDRRGSLETPRNNVLPA